MTEVSEIPSLLSRRAPHCDTNLRQNVFSVHSTFNVELSACSRLHVPCHFTVYDLKG